MVALTASGAISFENAANDAVGDSEERGIINVFGGSRPHSLSEYYGEEETLPTGGAGDKAISMTDFYGLEAVGYGSFTLSPTSIDEDGTVAKFTLYGNGLAAGTTVGWTANATGGVEYVGVGADLEISYTSATAGFSTLTTNTGTLTINGDKFEMWVRAKADNLDDDQNPETFTVTIDATDSNNISTNSPSKTLSVNDTSTTPPSMPLSGDTLYTLTKGTDGNGDPILCYVCTEGSVTPPGTSENSTASGQFKVIRTATGYELQGRALYADGIVHYDAVGNTIVESMFDVNTGFGSASDWRVLYKGVGGIPTAVSLNGGQTWTATPSEGNALTITFDAVAQYPAPSAEGSTNTVEVLKDIDLWIRTSQYLDTQVAEFTAAASANATYWPLNININVG